MQFRFVGSGTRDSWSGFGVVDGPQVRDPMTLVGWFVEQLRGFTSLSHAKAVWLQPDGVGWRTLRPPVSLTDASDLKPFRVSSQDFGAWRDHSAALFLSSHDDSFECWVDGCCVATIDSDGARLNDGRATQVSFNLEGVGIPMSQHCADPYVSVLFPNELADDVFLRRLRRRVLNACRSSAGAQVFLRTVPEAGTFFMLSSSPDISIVSAELAGGASFGFYSWSFGTWEPLGASINPLDAGYCEDDEERRCMQRLLRQGTQVLQGSGEQLVLKEGRRRGMSAPWFLASDSGMDLHKTGVLAASLVGLSFLKR